MVIIPNALGDALGCLPAICWLREKFQHVAWEIIADWRIGPLLNQRLPEYVHYALPESIGLVPLTDVVVDMRGNLESISWVADLRGVFSIGLPIEGHVYDIVDTGWPWPSQVPFHVAYANLLCALGLNLSNLRPPSLPLREAKQKIHPNRSVVVSPGAGCLKKRWPSDRFMDVMSWLRKKDNNIHFWVLVGPAEQELEEIFTSGSKDDTTIIGIVPFEEIAALLQGCILFVGNDNGFMHLACALARPVVAVFTRTSPLEWFPYQQPFQRAVYYPSECSPRLRCAEDDCEHFCATNVSVDDVTDVINFVLNPSHGQSS